MEDEINLARAKFEFLEKTYKQVSANFEYLEKKAQLFFTFITIVFGATILNSGFINAVRDAVQTSSLGDKGIHFLLIALVVLIASTLFSILALARVIRGRYWMANYPDNLSFEFYAENSKFLNEQNELSFLNELGFRFAVAIEHNRDVNSQKYIGLEIATWCINISVFTFFVVLIMLFLSAIS